MSTTTDLAQIRADVKAALDARDFCGAGALAKQAADDVGDELEAILDRAAREGRALLASESRRVTQMREVLPELRAAVDAGNADGRRQVEELRRQFRDSQEASRRSNEQWWSSPKPGGSVRVGSEPRTYDRGSEARGVSFLRDVAQSALGSHDSGLHERLSRHVQECRVDGLLGDGPEQRDVGTSAWAGLVVPQYLTDLVAPAARAMAPTVAICNRHPLPPDGMTVNISRVTTASAVAVQATENAAVQETDMDDTLLTVNVRTYAGQQDISRQAVERGTGVDQTTMQDLAAAYWTAVDSAILNSDGTGGTHLGVRSTVGIVAVTFTSASPTATLLWPLLADALQQCQTGSYMGVSHFVMHPRRWWWLASRTGTDRPFLHTEGVSTDQGGEIGGSEYLASSRQVFGVPVVVDGNMVTNVSSTQDVILAVTAPELHFWDDGVQFIRAEQPGAANLTIKFVLYGYSAFTAGRYPGAHGTISGTGLTTPTF